jgi:hypothetical protein
MKKLLVLIVLVAACGGSEPKKELVYVQDTPPTAGVFLRLVALDEQSLTLEVVGNEIEHLYGLAFRLYYNPHFLDFSEMIPSAAWPANAISIARKNRTGVLIAAITNRGPATGLDFSDQVLATLHFQIQKEGDSCIAFTTRGCALVDTTGAQIPDHIWVGGSLELR